MNPYNHNPFKTDNNRVKNERDANRELAETARKTSHVWNERRYMIETEGWLDDGLEDWEK